jgi:molybdopterin/thiamine biosynthesis adenylyltransferase
MNDEVSRQSFLGADADRIFASCKIGTVGLSGGGSHIIQQTTHVGVRNHVVIDPKRMEKKHLHRLVGSTEQDVKNRTPKVRIAERIIKGIRPQANVEIFESTWQDVQLALRDCTVIFGCVDTYSEREQLDRFCRRFLIPFIDIGMDVLKLNGRYRIVGQVIMSSPGHPCLRCMGILTEEKLKQEAAEYGAAGPRAQVIWPNGVLASTAVGLFVQLVVPWFAESSAGAYVEYNGNTPRLAPSPRMEYAINQTCAHFGAADVGDPFFKLEGFTK